MSQTVKLLSLSEYECFVLESLYRQVAKEDGHQPRARARKRIRDEYIATLGKKKQPGSPYRRHTKSGDTEKTFKWKPAGSMRTIRKTGE